MSILGRLFKKRAQKIASSQDWLVQAPAAGVMVNTTTAMRASAVYACIKILAETIASLPLIVYKRTPGSGKERAFDHPLFNLLHDSPNQNQTSFELREMGMGFLCLRGNAYFQLIRNKGAKIVEIQPLTPEAMTVKRNDKDGSLIYEYNVGDGVQYFESYQILHLRGMSSDGIVGMNPIEALREAVSLSLATQEYGGRYFSNGARPGGVLMHPGKLGDEAVAKLRQSIQDLHGGASNSGRTAILEEGLKWEQIALSNEDSQFLETRKFQIEEICRIFRVPPHMIGALDRATFSNVEQMSLDFVVHTIRPWLVRWEQAMNKALFSPKERSVFFVEFLVDGLLRGDMLTRTQVLQMQRQNGVINADEWREIENKNPLPDGKGQDYLVPLNMSTSAINSHKMLTPEPTSPGPGVQADVSQPAQSTGAEIDSLRSLEPAFQAAFEGEILELISNEVAEIRNFARQKSRSAVESRREFAEKWAETHSKRAIKTLEKLAITWLEAVIFARKQAKRRLKLGENLRKTSQFTAAVVDKWAARWAETYQPRVEEAFRELPAIALTESLLAEFETDRARRQAGDLVDSIREAVDLELDSVEKNAPAANVNVTLPAPVVQVNVETPKVAPVTRTAKFSYDIDGERTVKIIDEPVQ